MIVAILLIYRHIHYTTHSLPYIYPLFKMLDFFITLIVKIILFFYLLTFSFVILFIHLIILDLNSNCHNVFNINNLTPFYPILKPPIFRIFGDFLAI